MIKAVWYFVVSGVLLSGLTSCESTKADSSGVPVRYTVIVSDQAGVPLDSATVNLYTDSDDSFTEITNNQGRALFEVESKINQFSFSRKGFWDLDTIDQVPQPADSTDLDKTILRIFRVHLEKITLSSTVSSSSATLSSSEIVSSSSSVE